MHIVDHPFHIAEYHRRIIRYRLVVQQLQYIRNQTNLPQRESDRSERVSDLKQN